jgi:hypothetical protein
MDQPQTTPTKKHELFTREYNLGDLLTLAWHVFSENFHTILIVVLIIYAPIALIDVFLGGAGSKVAGDDPTALWHNLTRTNSVVVSLLTLLAGVLAPLAIALLIKKNLDGQTVDYRTALKQAASRWLPGLGTTLLMGIFLVGLFILLIIPGIIFGIYWAFAIYAVMLNNKSGLEALQYSKSLVQGRWWRVFGYLLVFGLITAIVSWAINSPLAPFGNNPAVYFISSLLADLVSSFTIVASVLLFLNLEANKVPEVK